MSDAPSFPSPNPPAPATNVIAESTAVSATAVSAAPMPAPVPVVAPVATSIATPRLVTVNAVNWPHVLDFTQLFRGFRLAINPAKLAMALLAIVLIYCAGRLFDWAWGPQVYADEMQRYTTMTPENFSGLRSSRMEARAEAMDRLLGNLDLTVAQREAFKGNPAKAYAALKENYKKQFLDAVAAAEKQRAAEEALAGKGPLSGATKTPAENEQANRAAAAARLMGNMQSLDAIYGKGIFATFMKYETDQFDRLVENTLTFVRVTPVRAAGPNDFGTDGTIEGQAVSGGLLSRDPDRLWRSDTVLGCIANMTITAPTWVFTATGPMQNPPAALPETTGAWLGRMGYRALYLISLTALAIFSLLMLALAGAGISRLSALELAGIERAPLKDVFLFALRRLWVFVKAPLSPFLILLAIGLVMAVVAMLGAIPVIGPILIGLIFFAFMGVSFVLMLLLLGILGGFNLLYPTIAVEGADSFDAMSRSFAYVYARPWKLLFYTVTSLIYGVVTFLFVSFGVFLVLLLSHTFVGWGMNLFGTHYGALSGMPALQTLWPEPQFLRLISPVNWYVMSWPEFIGSICLHFWVFLLIAGIGAYVISYYFSSHTIIYLLLRRSVDGQNLKEIYLEEKP